MYHMAITLSIFPLVKFFSTWYMAVLAAFMLVLIAYPLLALVENSSFYKRIAVERKGGERIGSYSREDWVTLFLRPTPNPSTWAPCPGAGPQRGGE